MDCLGLCDACNEPFQQLRDNHRYCSSKCRNDARFRRFGLNLDDYNTMLTSQGGVCKICRSYPNPVLCVDHSHSTGEVRGLLCHKCNTALGLLADSPVLLLRAIQYLKGNL